jgi:hypothetical protein
LTGIIGHHKHFNKIAEAEEVKVAIMDELRTSHSQFLAIAPEVAIQAMLALLLLMSLPNLFCLSSCASAFYS